MCQVGMFELAFGGWHDAAVLKSGTRVASEDKGAEIQPSNLLLFEGTSGFLVSVNRVIGGYEIGWFKTYYFFP